MTSNELRLILKSENARYGRVNGFSFTHSGTNYAVLKGRIPLSLARKICEGIDNTKLQICVHGASCEDKPEDWVINAELADVLSENILFVEKIYKKLKEDYIKKAEAEGRIDDMYILYYHIHTEEGVRHVIKCIREGAYINQCLYDL